ncbi:MAG: GTPase family protein [Nostoc sp. ZfuVER08]|uniref:50S ribosome-binding GTPase n=1 Tax=Nostoc punctiforme FACHB-252 TaxID=1357509 RepID=A0ABR8H7T1_NOSPU|nr:50S ribosome-binding GTPase [Nostoc punctiforme]MBD2611604.1 50S ribosome-binding GTPase [Nostoc punctiforme FACHB-252]MDZ8011916.1 50S ribosome-binding GTPase [Nostoc sp. ZfuVER08]
MTEQHDPNSQQFSELTDSVNNKSLGGSWKNRVAGVWNKATTNLTQLLPVEQVAQTVIQWFSVSEAQVAEILEKVRAELPTTQALLVGKPQAGKSSIVRGLTGVSAEIVGQGFRPHTQHTQRYAYPSNDLPLLIFTDTVGLGDVNQDTQTIIEELLGDLEQETRSARILILTVKINDFATDSLRQIAQQLRQQYPDIPCLLAVTCLHEVYPPDTVDHLAYPPDFEEVNRAFTLIQETFAGLYDRCVLIDFTLEEDGYNPVFYGLEALRDTLAELLPQAEAQAIHQLLNREEAGNQIGNLYRDTARRYILPFAIMSATLAAVPLPFATMPVLTALQVSMVGLLGKLYGQTLTPSQAGGVVSAIAGGFLAQAIGRELVKFIPLFGSAIAASWAAAYTWALGEAACVYFGDLMGGKKPDPQRIQSVMQEAFKAAQERFKGIKR